MKNQSKDNGTERKPILIIGATHESMHVAEWLSSNPNTWATVVLTTGMETTTIDKPKSTGLSESNINFIVNPIVGNRKKDTICPISKRIGAYR